MNRIDSGRSAARLVPRCAEIGPEPSSREYSRRGLDQGPCPLGSVARLWSWSSVRWCVRDAGEMATVSRTAESSAAVRLCRCAGIMT
jgi:hypothetical protein